MIFQIFKKELIDTLRDRRTLMMMIVIPVMLFPIIMTIFVKVSSSFEDKANKEVVKIGYVATENNSAIAIISALPESYGKREMIAYKDTASLLADIRKDTLKMGVFVPGNFDNNINSGNHSSLKFYYDATNIGMQERADEYAKAVQNDKRTKQLAKVNLKDADINLVEAEFSNVASDQEMIGKLAGGILPYIFIAFGFIGCMYPAIDLFTGEKERGTMETLLTTPVPRWKLLIGKMGVIVCSGLLASTCALLGLVVAVEGMNLIQNPVILNVFHEVLTVKFVLMLYGLLIPLVIFFAGIMIPIAIYAKTFKEAQSIITPLNIVVVLPAMVGFFPGIELNVLTACIPIINVVLATKELIAGTLNPSLLALSFVIMSLLAFGSILLSYRKFDSESNVLS